MIATYQYKLVYYLPDDSRSYRNMYNSQQSLYKSERTHGYLQNIHQYLNNKRFTKLLGNINYNHTIAGASVRTK